MRSCMEFTTEAKNELEFWLGNLRALNCRPFRWSPSATRVVYSDASDSGYGGYTVELGPHVCYGQWTEEEAQHSSTWRELKEYHKHLPLIWKATQSNGTQIIRTLFVSFSMVAASCTYRTEQCAFMRDVHSMPLSWRWHGFLEAKMR